MEPYSSFYRTTFFILKVLQSYEDLDYYNALLARCPAVSINNLLVQKTAFKVLNRSFDHIIHILSLLSSIWCILMKDNNKYDKILLLMKHLVSLVSHCLIFFHAIIWHTQLQNLIWNNLEMFGTHTYFPDSTIFFFPSLVVRFH